MSAMKKEDKTVKARFFCLCMSPALDASVTLPAWPADGVIFKDVAETENVGGKGINVARWLALRGAEASRCEESKSRVKNEQG